MKRKNGASGRGVRGLAVVALTASMLVAAPVAAQAATMHGPFLSRGQCASEAQLYAIGNKVKVQDCWYDERRWFYYSY